MVATLRELLTGPAQAVNSIKALAEQNGWVIDRHDVGSRVHLHKNGFHFEVWVVDGWRVGVCACTGYSSGASSTAQPGTSNWVSHGIGESWMYYSTNTDRDGNPSKVRYCCTGNTIYCFFGFGQGVPYNMTSRAIAFGEITDKIGDWVGGQFVHSNYSYTNGYSGDCYLFSDYGTSYTDEQLQIKLDTYWTPNHPSYYRAVGRWPNCNLVRNKMPNLYNAGVLPLPIIIFLKNKADNSLYHPLGYAPGIRSLTGGDTYVDGDTITIGSDTYVCVQSRQGMAGDVADLAVKISS